MIKKYIHKVIKELFTKELERLKEEKLTLNKDFELWFKEAKQKTDSQIFKLDWFMKEYHANICDNCGKGFLAHYGGFYKRYNPTKILCSSKCDTEISMKLQKEVEDMKSRVVN